MGKGAKTKGYIKNLYNGRITEFLYNPTEYSTSTNINYSVIEAPGMTYPKFQFISGGEKTITFTVFLYGVRGEPKKFINEINSFLPIGKSGIPFAKPPLMLFAFGAYIKKCILVGFNEDYLEFNEDLSPKRVNIHLTLKVVA